MPVEAAVYIHDLNPANPTHTDAFNEYDAQTRLVKTVIVNSFPNITGPVTATQDALNQAAGANATAGTMEVAPNGTTAGGALKLDPVAGSGSVIVQNSGVNGQPGAFAVTINDATDANPVTVLSGTQAGAITAGASLNAPSILQAGSPLLPRGFIGMWWGSVASIPTGWALCNGANGTPNLQNAFILGAGLSFTPGQTGGAPSATVATDNQGTHFHGGATAAGGAASPSGVTDAQGAHSHTGATAGHSLTIAELAPHTHNIEIAQSLGGAGGFIAAGQGDAGPFNSGSAGSGTAHTHGISVDGNHQHNLSISAIPAHTHGIATDGLHAHNVTVPTVPPFVALCYIMKL